MTNSPILVLGATGKTGTRIVFRLRSRECPVRAASRTGDTIFDWSRPTTWDDAVRGVEAAYLITPSDADAVADFAASLRAAGGRRVVLLSDQNPTRTHLDIEHAVSDAFEEWTVLRPTWFAQNFSEGYFGTQLRDGELRLNVGETPVAFVDAEDIADAAVAALTETGHDRQIYELTGPRRLNFREALAEISRATGRDLGFVPLSDEDFHAEQLASGADPAVVNRYAAMFRRIREGACAATSPGVRAATGHAPRDFASYVATAVAAGAWR